MYIDRFVLPIDEEDYLISERMQHNGGEYGYIDNIYPCHIFSEKKLTEINFEKITIFYGGNGSGKSTLLNLIASKLELNRIAPFNTSELFSAYSHECQYELGYDEEGFKNRIPCGSRIITSDDIFDYMLTARTSNQSTGEKIEGVIDEWYKIKTNQQNSLESIDNYEFLRLAIKAKPKSQSRRKFIEKHIGKEIKLNSNGETALEYFETKLKNDTLYCLDEPENSLSPKLQIELAKMIEEMARYCGCQFIIATHSPFILSMAGARIYDLDSKPVDIKPWWKLDNPRTYFEFFEKYRNKFINDDDY